MERAGTAGTLRVYGTPAEEGGGGKAPNVVPDKAVVHYFLRSPDSQVLLGVWERVQAAARGAALGTGTEVVIKVDGGLYSLLPNKTLAQAADINLRQVGGVEYGRTERLFAESLYKTLDQPELAISSANEVPPLSLDETFGGGSTDVGDVSWVVPNVGLSTASWVPGTAAHSWQAVAASGYSIGFKRGPGGRQGAGTDRHGPVPGPRITYGSLAGVDPAPGRKFRVPTTRRGWYRADQSSDWEGVGRHHR